MFYVYPVRTCYCRQYPKTEREGENLYRPDGSDTDARSGCTAPGDPRRHTTSLQQRIARGIGSDQALEVLEPIERVESWCPRGISRRGRPSMQVIRAQAPSYRMGSPCSCATGSRSGRRGAAPPGTPTRAARAPACPPAALGSCSTARRPPPWPASGRAAGTCQTIERSPITTHKNHSRSQRIAARKISRSLHACA
jgi:hypothetical protein